MSISPAEPRPTRRAAAVLLLATLAVGCGESRRAAEVPSVSRGPRVDVFLRASGTATVDVRIELASLRLRAADASEVELPLQRSGVSSMEASRRLSLGGGAVPAGTYRALLVELAGASVRRAGTVQPLRLLPQQEAGLPGAGEESEDDEQAAAPEEGAVYELPINVELGRRDVSSLFVEWNVDASLVGEDGLRLALGLSQERAGGRLGLLYVADAAAGTVLTVDRSTGEVVGSVPAGAEPRGLALGEAGLRVVTANAGAGSITVLDARTGWTHYNIPVQLSARTADVEIVPGQQLAAAVNPGLDTVSVFDIRQLVRLGDVRVGRQPVRLAVAGDPYRLFVACRLNDSLDVVDLSSRSLVASLRVLQAPTDVTIDRTGRLVIVSHYSAPFLSIYDADTLAPEPATIQVGDRMTAVLADVNRNRVYVAREGPAEIAVVDLRMQTVIRRIPISGRVDSLAQPRQGGYLYGAAPELGALVVVNVVRLREEDPLPCGNAPSYVVSTD